MAGLNEKTRYPVFFIGSLMMMVPGILVHFYNVLTVSEMEWSIGLGFLLFIISLSMGLFERHKL